MSAESSELQLNWQPEIGEADLMDEALTGLATKMKLYDRLSHQREVVGARRDRVTPTLGRLDLDVPPEQYPTHIAYAALSLYMLNTKLSQIEGDIHDLDHRELLLARHFSGKKVEITSLNPDRHRLGRFADSGHDQLSGSKKSYRSKRGEIVEINMSPVNGGDMLIAGFGKRRYRAGPLVDRRTDYEPTFSFKFL